MIRRPLFGQELSAGVIFMAIGATAVLLSTRYEFGTVAQMGPGFFPTVLGVLLVLLGAGNCARVALSGQRSRILHAPLRTVLLIPASALVFAFLVERAGLALAVLATALLACLAGVRFRLLEALLSAAILAFFTSLFFIYALDLPLSILPP